MQVLPKISIVTPSYDQGKYLEETILSVLDQNYPDLEYSIVDGGSSDNSLDVIRKYEDKISFWLSEKDSGQSEAINKGFKRAGGEIVAWLNSDDLYCAGALMKVGEYFQKHPDVDIVYGDVINFSEDGNEILVRNEFNIYDFFSRVSIHQPAVFWRRKIMEHSGFLDESLHYCMDYDLWMKLFMNFKSARINSVLAKFRVHGFSKTNSNPIELYREYQKVVSRFFNSLPDGNWAARLTLTGVQHAQNDPGILMRKQYPAQVLEKLFLIYLNACLEIEYTRKNYKGVRAMVFQHPGLLINLKSFKHFIKSFLR